MNQETFLETSGEFSAYSVKLDNFEGPLDLLLFLIRKQEIDVYDIPIARITQQYLDYIQMMEMLDLEMAGEFILMAASLIRIKTRMLLPAPPEEGEEDPRPELVQALLEHEKFQNVAGQLAEKEKEELLFHPRADFSFLPDFEPLVELKPPTLFELLSTYKIILDRQAKQAYHTVKLPEVSLEERIEHVLACLQDRNNVLFEELCQDIPLKIYLVVTLLAVLELTRRGWVGFEQKLEFGPISLWRNRN